jgi:hypothetical protein
VRCQAVPPMTGAMQHRRLCARGPAASADSDEGLTLLRPPNTHSVTLTTRVSNEWQQAPMDALSMAAMRPCPYAHRSLRSSRFSTAAQLQRASLPAIDPRLRHQIVSSPPLDPKKPTRVRLKLQLYAREDTPPICGSQLLKSQALPHIGCGG